MRPLTVTKMKKYVRILKYGVNNVSNNEQIALHQIWCHLCNLIFEIHLSISNFFMLQRLRNQKNENLLHTFNDITLMASTTNAAFIN